MVLILERGHVLSSPAVENVHRFGIAVPGPDHHQCLAPLKGLVVGDFHPDYRAKHLAGPQGSRPRLTRYRGGATASGNTMPIVGARTQFLQLGDGLSVKFPVIARQCIGQGKSMLRSRQNVRRGSRSTFSLMIASDVPNGARGLLLGGSHGIRRTPTRRSAWTPGEVSTAARSGLPKPPTGSGTALPCGLIKAWRSRLSNSCCERHEGGSLRMMS